MKLEASDRLAALKLYDAAESLSDGELGAEVHLRRARVRWSAADWDGAEADLSAVLERGDDPVLEAEALLLAAHVTWDPGRFRGQLESRLAATLDRLPVDEVVLRARVEACIAGGIFQTGAAPATSDPARRAIRTTGMRRIPTTGPRSCGGRARACSTSTSRR